MKSSQNLTFEDDNWVTDVNSHEPYAAILDHERENADKHPLTSPLDSSTRTSFAEQVSTPARVALVVEDSIGLDEAGAQWRSDLDPGALPPTPTMSASQRRLMRASLVHFASRGYGGSNVRDIAATLGVQAASVYKHFESKEAILAELVHLGYDFHRGQILEAVLSAPSGPEAQLTAFMSTHVRLHTIYPRLSDVVHHEWTHLSEQHIAETKRLDAETTSLLRGILERGIESKTFRIRALELTINAISGLGTSVATWFPYQTEHSADDVVEHLTATALTICGVSG